MDNNFVQGKGGLGENYLPANPYAQKSAIVNKFPQIDNCKYYASFSYNITSTTATITPLTGHLSGDLRYYRVEITDGVNFVSGTLDLAARTTPFTIATASLDFKKPWTVSFYGEEGDLVGDTGCSLAYSFVIANPAFASGDTVPSVDRWDNVKFLLKLVSTDDADFTLFPVNGVEISRNGSIDIQDYTTTGTLKQGGEYILAVEAKKVGLNPSIALPVGSAAVINDVDPQVAHPYALSTKFVDIDHITIETATNGTFTGTLASDLTNEGVTPSISIRINTIVA